MLIAITESQNMTSLFNEEFLRELNFKARLIHKAETLRKSDNIKYSKLVDKYGAQHRKLNYLPIQQLKQLIQEIESG